MFLFSCVGIGKSTNFTGFLYLTFKLLTLNNEAQIKFCGA